MVEYTLFEKIKTVFNLITSTPLFLILILGIILMIIDILFISKKDKTTKKIYGILSILIIILFIYSYINSIQSIFNALSKNIVSLVYFPTVLQYITTLIISLSIFIYSIKSKKINKIEKRINLLVLLFNSLLFLLIIDQINKTEVDLSNQISIYSNSTLMILFELSLLIFIFWVTGLILYKIINRLSPKPIKNNIIMSEKDLEEPELPKLKEVKNEDKFTLDEYQKLKEILQNMQNNKKDT